MPRRLTSGSGQTCKERATPRAGDQARSSCYGLPAGSLSFSEDSPHPQICSDLVSHREDGDQSISGIASEEEDMPCMFLSWLAFPCAESGNDSYKASDQEEVGVDTAGSSSCLRVICQVKSLGSRGLGQSQ